MPYRIEFKPSAAKVLRRLPKDSQRRVAAAIDGLSKNPRPPGAEALKGGEGLLRIRVGDYRVIYSVHTSTVTVLVLVVGHRREVYRHLKR